MSRCYPVGVPSRLLRTGSSCRLWEERGLFAVRIKGEKTFVGEGSGGRDERCHGSDRKFGCEIDAHR